MKTYVRLFTLFFIVIFAAGCTSAAFTSADRETSGDLPWEINPFGASYDEISAAAEAFTMEGEHGVRILLSEGYFKFSSDGSLTAKYRWVYKILDQTGIDNWSSTQVSWTPWNQDKPTIKVRVTNPDGNSYFLSEDHIIESTESSETANIYSDRKLLQAPFPKIMVGSIVEEETVVKSAVPKFGTGISRTWYFEGSNPIAMNRLIVVAADNLPFTYKVSLKDDLVPEIEGENGFTKYTFTYPMVPVSKDIEYGLPIDHPHWMSVGFTTGESWEKIARVYSDLVDENLQGADFSRELELLAEDNSYDTAVNAVEWLNNEIRYTGLELGTGSIIPTIPSVTLERGFGDCKDKALIVIGILRAAGYNADIALLRAGTSTDIDPDLPSLSGFNHAIVYVGGEDPFWIDPTSEFSFNGYFPLSDQNRWSLVASPSTSGLIKTSSSVPEDNKTVRNIEYFLKDAGFADVEESTVYYGSEDSSYRSRYLFMKEDDIKTGIDDYIRRAYRFGENSGFEYSDPKDFGENFNVSLKIKGAGRGVTENSQAIVAIMQGELTNYLPDIFRVEDKDGESTKRENDYYFYKPFIFKSIYTVHPPAGFSLRELPESETLELGSVEVKKSYELNDGVVTAVLSINSGKRLLDPDEFDETKTAVLEFSRENPVLLVFDHIGEKLLSQGDYRGSIDYLKKISEENPGKEIHLIRLADALLKAGLGLDAQKAARKAVAINGESEIAYSKLAWVLQHDALGRRLAPGYDRDGAIAAYRRAIELDDEEWSNFANLAILLEYDKNGLRYASSDLAEAVETYKLIGDRLSENGMDLNVLTDLLYLKDWNQLEESLKKITNQKTVTLYRVVMFAAEGNFSAAIGEASKTGDNQDKLTLLSNAGELLIYIRNYKSAAVLFREAARGSEDSISLESRADVLEGTVLNENITFDPEDPEDLVKKFYRALYLSEGTDFEIFKSLLTDDLYTRALDSESVNNFISQWWVLRNESIRTGLSLNVVLDLFLSDLKFQTRMDIDGGYHLKLIQTGLNTNIDSNFYIQNVEGVLRIAATDNFRTPVGAVVLDYLDSGRLQSAAEWLNWYYKDYSYFGREGDEPLYGQPLQGFWKKRGNDETDIVNMRIAAASILVTDKSLYNNAAAILEAALKDPGNRALRDKLYYAVYYAYKTGDNFKGQNTASKWLYDRYPESDFAFSAFLRSLLNLEQYDELETLARERLSEDEEDGTAIDMLINMYFSRLDFNSVDRIFENLKSKNQLSARLYNAVAWMYLFEPVVDERALEYARQAVNMSNNANTAILHTLAALYAEFGRCEEARNTLDRVMKLSGSIEPSSDDWYVLGRIAEEYGMTESALYYYGKVEKPGPGMGRYDSSYVLAERRLSIIKSAE